MTDTTISQQIIEHLSCDSSRTSTFVFYLEQGMPLSCFAGRFEDVKHVVDILVAELLEGSAHR